MRYVISSKTWNSLSKRKAVSVSSFQLCQTFIVRYCKTSVSEIAPCQIKNKQYVPSSYNFFIPFFLLPTKNSVEQKVEGKIAEPFNSHLPTHFLLTARFCLLALSRKQGVKWLTNLYKPVQFAKLCINVWFS